jgi:8-oxo-dGTP pyrophosphatase MutT (NUDIX family)
MTDQKNRTLTPLAENFGVPVTPKNAASLMIYRQDGDDLRILMGKRGATAKFIPDAYVFPGGRYEKRYDEDRHKTQAIELPRQLAKHIGQTKLCADIASGLVQASLRETNEETGLDYSKNVISKTTFIGRAITPKTSPIRFHARFFACPADCFYGELGGDGELNHLHWPTIDEALDNLPLIDVTEHMLEEIRRRHQENTLNPAKKTPYSSAIYVYRDRIPAPRSFGPL